MSPVPHRMLLNFLTKYIAYGNKTQVQKFNHQSNMTNHNGVYKVL